jgi:hypothetical protein
LAVGAPTFRSPPPTSRQFTVSEKLVELCCEPDFASTVIVDVEDGEADDPPIEKLLLQPLTRPNPIRLTASSSTGKQRRFFQPKQHKTAPSAVTGNNGCPPWGRAALAVVVVTVSVVEAAAPEGVTLAGAKLHDAPEGSPEQLSETAEVNPLCGVTVVVAVPLFPAWTVSDAGETTTEKLCAVRLIV